MNWRIGVNIIFQIHRLRLTNSKILIQSKLAQLMLIHWKCSFRSHRIYCRCWFSVLLHIVNETQNRSQSVSINNSWLLNNKVFHSSFDFGAFCALPTQQWVDKMSLVSNVFKQIFVIFASGAMTIKVISSRPLYGLGIEIHERKSFGTYQICWRWSSMKKPF